MDRGRPLSGGTAVHYRCDEQADWMPDLADIERKASDRTKAIVIINPNNPTGAVYSEEMLRGLTDIARLDNLLVCSDEIYDKILYDGATHTPTAAVAPDLLTSTFNGMSKAYRVAGYRVGWMAVWLKAHASSYIEGLTILANMRLCAKMPWPARRGRRAERAADDQRSRRLPGGRLLEQRDTAYDLLTQIPGVTCVKPKGVLTSSRGSTRRSSRSRTTGGWSWTCCGPRRSWWSTASSNWPEPDHFRVVTLPTATDLAEAVKRIGTFLDGYSQP
ncbi:alanine transaminase OS=Streptomyces alboniger OX=132473 GN=CP975_22330 PE=3 SV=1 [Streptomyces alboniger]